jgi:hypothetical protein
MSRCADVTARGLTVGILMAVTIGLPACSSPVPGSSPCLPEPLHVDPSRVGAGTAVTVTSDGFKCHGSYPAGRKYHLTLGFVGRASLMDLGGYPVNTDGSFHSSVTIPANAPPGEARIIVSGSSFDQCTGSNPPCLGYVVRLEILSPGT